MKHKFVLYLLATMFGGAIGSMVYLAKQTPTVPLIVPISINSDCSVSELAQLDLLWQHVYHPKRLQIVEKCKAVSGTIYSVKKEMDGDLHIRLIPDPQYESLINSVNVSGQLGKLVVEPICVNIPPSQVDAIDACKGFSYPLEIPTVGDHVKIVGSYVLDNQHGGWAEIHPVVSFSQL